MEKYIKNKLWWDSPRRENKMIKRTSKKFIACLLSLAMVFVLVGCDKKEKKDAKEPNKKAVDEVNAKVYEAYKKVLESENKEEYYKGDWYGKDEEVELYDYAYDLAYIGDKKIPKLILSGQNEGISSIRFLRYDEKTNEVKRIGEVIEEGAASGGFRGNMYYDMEGEAVYNEMTMGGTGETEINEYTFTNGEHKKETVAEGRYDQIDFEIKNPYRPSYTPASDLSKLNEYKEGKLKDNSDIAKYNKDNSKDVDKNTDKEGEDAKDNKVQNPNGKNTKNSSSKADIKASKSVRDKVAKYESNGVLVLSGVVRQIPYGELIDNYGVSDVDLYYGRSRNDIYTFFVTDKPYNALALRSAGGGYDSYEATNLIFLPDDDLEYVNGQRVYIAFPEKPQFEGTDASMEAMHATARNIEVIK